MAGYDAFDPRLDSLVVETKTTWGPDVQGLSDEEKTIVAQAIHRHPQLATHIKYERTHTGFIREITLTTADIENLYHHNISLAGSA